MDALAWLMSEEDAAAAAAAAADAAGGSGTGLDEEEEDRELSIDELPLRSMRSDDVPAFIGMVLGAAAGSCTVVAGWLMLLRFAPRVAVWSSLVSFVLAQILFGVWLLLDSNGFGILVILLAGFSALLCVILRRWLPFALVMIGLAMDILKRNPLLCDISLGTLVVQMVWMAIWCAAASGIMMRQTEDVPLIDLLLLVLSLFWTAQVVKNVAHVAVAGVAAGWYFDTQEEGQKPLRASLKRALTSSFGSICLGSLVVGLLRTLNTISHVATGSNQRNAGHMYGQQQNVLVSLCRAACVAYSSLFARLMPLFNQYAFTQIAIYGLGYTAAAKASYNMVHEVHGGGRLSALISNSLLLMVVAVGSIWCGLIAGIVGIGIAHATPITSDEFYGAGFLPRWFVGVLCGVIGMAVSLPGVEALEATITAIFVCYAREPNYLEMRRPAVAKQVDEALSMIEAETGGAGDDEYEYEDDDDADGGGRRRGGDGDEDDEYEYEDDEGP